MFFFLPVPLVWKQGSLAGGFVPGHQSCSCLGLRPHAAVAAFGHNRGRREAPGGGGVPLGRAELWHYRPCSPQRSPSHCWAAGLKLDTSADAFVPKLFFPPTCARAPAGSSAASPKYLEIIWRLKCEEGESPAKKPPRGGGAARAP